MQNIGIIIENEKHDELFRSDINFVDILNTVHEIDDKNKFPLISSIDPFGLTTFNFIQVPYLKYELKKLADNLTVEGRKSVSELLLFLEKIERHKYLVFVGD
jgi:hypothetical protein